MDKNTALILVLGAAEVVKAQLLIKLFESGQNVEASDLAVRLKRLADVGDIVTKMMAEE